MARTILILAACLLAMPAWAQEAVTGSVEIAGRGVEESGNLNRAAEYRTTDSGPELRLALEAELEKLFLSLESEAVDQDEQRHRLTLDLGRMVRSHTTFNRLPHRLEHDPLSNLDGTVKEVVWTGSTDTDPLAQYYLRFQQLANHTELQLPSAGWLTVYTDYREQWREGHEQAMALSHCSVCHVSSESRETDQHMRTAGIGARLALGRFTVDGSVASRDFRERGETPTHTYIKAEQPAQRLPLFDDRVWYDDSNGALPYDYNPPTEKDMAKLKVSHPNLGGFAVNLVGVGYDLTNTSSGNEVEYRGVNLAAARRLGRKARFSLRARTYSIDSTEYFIDVVEPVAVAGPYKGKTYQQRYGFEPDFLRTSAIDREVTEADARLSYRLGRRTTLTGTYSVQHLDRDFYEVATGQTTTLTNKGELLLSTRLGKGVQLRARLTAADIERPFMVIDATCQSGPLQTTPVPSPLVPGSTQYYQLHASRVAEATASPTWYTEIWLSGTYQLGVNSLASLSARHWDGENDDQDLTQWSRTLDAVTASVAWAPSETSELHVAASWAEREMESRFCIPLMDG